MSVDNPRRVSKNVLRPIRNSDSVQRSSLDSGGKKMATQPHWYFCQNCSSMIFSANDAHSGRCVAGNEGAAFTHGAQGFEFTLPYATQAETPPGQPDWHFCRKCNSMFFCAIGGNPGPCVVGGDHDGTGSFDFVLPHSVAESPGTQRDWRFCRKCNVLFYGGDPGACVTGAGHDATGSFDFVLPHSSHWIKPWVYIDHGTELNPVEE